MNTKKVEFSEDVIHLINELNKKIYNIQSTEQLQFSFGNLTWNEIKNAIDNITKLLPDEIFLTANKKKLEEIKGLCAREFIFFLIQEQSTKEHYKHHLSEFIYLFSKELQKKALGV